MLCSTTIGAAAYTAIPLDLLAPISVAMLMVMRELPGSVYDLMTGAPLDWKYTTCTSVDCAFGLASASVSTCPADVSPCAIYQLVWVLLAPMTVVLPIIELTLLKKSWRSATIGPLAMISVAWIAWETAAF